MLRYLMRIERNAHRHPLHDLDPVAGGVLSREQRERRARTRTESGHLAMITEAATVEVGSQGHRLSDAHAGELRLPEVRVDPYRIQRHNRHQGRTGADPLTKLHSPTRNKSRYRRWQNGPTVTKVSVARQCRAVSRR